MKNIPLVPRVALVDLARQVDRLLKMQDALRTRRTSDVSGCRDAERRLSRNCRDIIEHPESQPTLFADESKVAEAVKALPDKLDAMNASSVLSARKDSAIKAMLLDVAAQLTSLADSLGRGHGDRHTAIRQLRVEVGRLRSAVPVSEGGVR